MEGTIAELDAADGLGWIVLDDGRRVRFGIGACRFPPAVGLRVRVASGLEVVRGRLKARSVELVPLAFDLEEHVWPRVTRETLVAPRWMAGGARELRIRRTLFDRDAEHRRAPGWAAPADFAELVFAPPPAEARGWLGLVPPPPHPFFAPWHEGIVATAVGALDLAPGARLPADASRLGGVAAKLVGGWPACAKGHGPMTLLLVVAGRDLAPIFSGPSGGARVPMRLTIHGCPACLREQHQTWLGRREEASVEWRPETEGEVRAAEPAEPLPALRLAARRVLSFPPSWIFAERRDVEGHEPVGGTPARVLSTKLLLQDAADPDAEYEDALLAYDRHYASSRNLLVGGFSPFRFALCRACGRPMKQVVHLDDYMTEGAFGDLFDGSNELTLLACDRTPACGGPEKGLLVVDP